LQDGGGLKTATTWSGQSFAEYMRANVFRPLHTLNSQYGLPPRFRDVMATPYDGLGSALPILRHNELSAAGLTTKVDISGAMEIFRLNVEEFPQDANVYDSLGEAYLKKGEKGLAIENYRKSLELNPQNDNARDVLKKLEVPQR